MYVHMYICMYVCMYVCMQKRYFTSAKYIKVAGLKPPAVTDTPMDPRVFIVNRAGDATEVVS
jgi:hypothetical protein